MRRIVQLWTREGRHWNIDRRVISKSQPSHIGIPIYQAKYFSLIVYNYNQDYTTSNLDEVLMKVKANQ